MKTNTGLLRDQLATLDFNDGHQRIAAGRLRVELGIAHNRAAITDPHGDKLHRLALCCFRRAIHGLQSVQGHDVEIARAHTGIAICQWFLDGPGAALDDARLGVEKLPPNPSKEVCGYRLAALSTLALCYFETGAMTSARQNFALALDIANNLGEKKQAIDTLQRRLAITYLEDGDAKMAAQYLEKAIPDHNTPMNDQLAWLNANVLTCERVWQFQQALGYYDQVLGIFETETEPPWDKSAAVTNAALLFSDLNQQEQLTRAQNILAKVPKTALPLSVRLGRNRLDAALALRQGANDEAVSYLKTMQDLVWRQADADPLKLREITLEMTRILLNQDRAEEAVIGLRDRLAQDAPADMLGISLAKTDLEISLSQVQMQMGEVEQPARSLRDLFARVMALSDYEAEYQFWVTLADIKGRLKDNNVAIFLGKMAAERLPLAACELRNNPAEQQALIGRHVGPLRRLIDLLIHADRFAEANQIQQIVDHEARAVLVRGLRIIPDPGPGKRIDYQAEERVLFNDITLLQTMAQGNRTLSLTPHADQAQLVRCLQRYHAHEKQADALFERISSGNWAVRNDPAPVPSMAQDRVTLQENEALLRIVSGHDNFVILLEQASGAALQPLVLNRADILGLVYQFWRATSNCDSDVTDLARQLYDKLIAPFEVALDGIETLKIIAPGPFSHLPFAALFDGSRYVIERMAVSYLPVYPIAEDDPSDGDDLCNHSDLNDPVADAPAKRSAPAGLGTSRAHDHLPPLLFARRELQEFERHMRARPSGLDDAFTDTALAQTLADHPTILHIAAHFVAVPGSLYESHLALGAGRLPVAQLLDERFDWCGLPLLVLSACSTAIRDAGDGVMQDLTTLLMQRGVRSVLSALWPISDMATCVLMDNFYQELAAHDEQRPEQALATAQRCMIAGGRAPGLSHEIKETEDEGDAEETATLKNSKDAGCAARGLTIGSGDPGPDHAHPYYWAGFKYQVAR